MDYILDDYFGFYVRKARFDKRQIIESVQQSRFYTVVLDMIKYARTVKVVNLVESMPHLANDLIRLESMSVVQSSSEAFLTKWRLVREGIISRVWGSKAETDEIEKMRSMMRFFPLPYVADSNNVISLLLERDECTKWARSFYLDETSKPAPNRCGCNCSCSTKLGVMIANEVGILGTKIHYVVGDGHAYIAVGNRDTDWVARQVQVIETTSRHRNKTKLQCTKPLIELQRISSDLYTKNDYLLPNVYEFYITSISDIYETKERSEEVGYFALYLLRNQATNLFGADKLALVAFTYKNSGLNHVMKQLLQKEIDFPTLNQMPSSIRLFSVLWLLDLSDAMVRENLTILLERVNVHSMFGPTSKLALDLKEKLASQ
jgi:hypothetical protein